MANPQPDKFTRISNELYEAIMQTDFSKRQRNILDLVLRMSYGCRKKFAILRPSDFELAGVGRNHVKQELQYLSSAKVLVVDGDLIGMNKNYEQWRVNLIKMFDHEKFNKVLKRNLDDATVPEMGIKVPETGTFNQVKTIPKTGTGVPETGIIENAEFPKQEYQSSQNGNSRVPKTGIGTSREPSHDAACGDLKESIKEIYKESSSGTKILNTNQDTEEPEQDNSTSFQNLFGIYQDNFTENGEIKPLEAELFGGLFDDYGGEWLLEAMRETYRQSPEKRTLAYIQGVLRGYAERGEAGPDHNRQKSKTSKHQRELEAIDQFIAEEEKQRGTERAGQALQDD
ncbi:replication protein [Xylanibacillus composti]|uniref:Bacteriophage lambda Replication protein O N-terminal domain-containing protein n=1 Tax=Xylanibacillus composti TaxID=1572762 RepID=A0A8J4H108_9BACL|nr:replication protein [Xylanibacillus composti]MDT9723805.1 replication protein [Xylanibacillus composti]GIQ67421.1 hypothetical protein XYCOK13_02450 [Xylanibacillus composti]